MVAKSIEEILQEELEARVQLAAQVMSIILQRYQSGKGWVKRGEIQDYVYSQLGMQGKSGNHFARFVTKVLQENGYRKSYSRGQRVYYGLVIKETN